MSSPTITKEDFIHRLVGLNPLQGTGASSGVTEHFGSRFFHFVPFAEIEEEHQETFVSAAAITLEHLVNFPGPGPKVAVRESRLGESRQTVIAVLQRDSPFLVDSIRMELSRLGCPIHSLLSVILDAKRDREGNLVDVDAEENGDGEKEAAICVITDPLKTEAEREEIRAALADILEDVRLAVTDFQAMRDRALAESARLEAENLPFPSEEVAEARKFLEWIASDRFIFLGFDEHRILEKDGQHILEPVRDSALGTMKRHSSLRHWVLESLPEEARSFVEAATILTFVNSTHRSRVHRPVYPEYITVRRFDPSGKLLSACRFLGLFSSAVYNELPSDIPLVRLKVQHVLANSGFDHRGHYFKALVGVLNAYPRAELFQASESELFETAMAIVQAEESPRVRLFLRRNPFGRFYYCQVFVPKEIYHTELRHKIQDLLCRRLQANDVDFTTHMGESELGRMRFLIRVPERARIDITAEELEREVIEVARSWRDRFREEIFRQRNDEEAGSIFRLYRNAFPTSYREHFSTRTALQDLDSIAELGEGVEISLRLSRRPGDNGHLSLRLFHRKSPLPLSDVMPILENMGLRTHSEHPYRITRSDGTVWLNHFTLVPAFAIDLESEDITTLFREAFLSIWGGLSENDAFNALILGASLTWRETAMLRAYARYNHQAQFGFGTVYTAETLARHLNIARMLCAFFRARFDPEETAREMCSRAIHDDILALLEDVPSLNEDRVLRRFLELMNATLRTNFFQTGRDGAPKAHISIKLDPAKIPNLPRPRPAFEIFVYSPRLEGVHLRGGKIARGGLRWSDRPEDFRTEVLGLVKAQQVKNAVIVPSGAKGGFVAHQLPAGDRDAVVREGQECYRTFLRGLLDLTDNLVNGEVVPPPQLVRHDSDDPYLVVAADKGTATFSDIGNSISEEYGFWMGDAFASGGSEGYDHKKMGITAKGAWVSVQRHFCELGIDVQTEDITVVGIGDMAGDVFGNGMLCSEHIKLVAAFNHLHIFVDPDPDAARSFQERKRLFEEVKGWGSYDTSLLSEGGAIFSRQQKVIHLGPRIRECFGIEEEEMTPNEFISELLRAPVDLLWNGGIGTFVKATDETHEEAGDKSNDALRINASELRCRVIGEGGNLGFTQRARVEFSLNGGFCNTDFIDNSAGVDCSDHEVNLKIPLNGMMARNELTREARNELLSAMTGAVADLVLQNNYRQTRAISLAQEQSLKRTVEYTRLLEHWERIGVIDRELEALPDNETLAERTGRKSRGLTRPELSVLIAYSKSALKEALIRSDVPDDPLMSHFVEKAFPDQFVDQFREELSRHQLRREIVATQWANDLVNHMGPSYIYRLEEGTGASSSEIARAYAAAREIFSMPEFWEKIEKLDHTIAPDVQHRMMYELGRLVRRGSRWLLRNCRENLSDVPGLISRFQPGVQQIAYSLRGLLHEAARDYWKKNYRIFTKAGVPDDLAAAIAGSSGLFSSLGVIYCAEQTGTEVDEAAQVYYWASDALDLHWLSYRIRDLSVADHWQARSRESFRDELHIQQRQVTINILNEHTSGSPEARIRAWLDRRRHFAERWHIVLEEFRASGRRDYAVFPVVMRELAVLVNAR